MKNDGITNLNYSLSDDVELNEKLSLILNEACHVFHHHADGNWKSVYKPKYSHMLAEHITSKLSLIRKLLVLKDPVVSNITYAAIELNNAHNKSLKSDAASGAV